MSISRIDSVKQRQSFIILLLVFIWAELVLVSSARAQFRDDFSHTSPTIDPRGLNGWAYYTGDGSALMNFTQSVKGYAAIDVDATKDKRNVWWALIRRCVSGTMDLGLLTKPQYNLRLEARIKVSHAPRRVNLHFNTQRTTDFHSNLMEFDIPDTLDWHTISMTTHGFDACPGDTVYAQLALMDWGLGKYRVLIDHFKAEVVRMDIVGPDLGSPVPYHPPIPDPKVFSYHLAATNEASIDREYPDVQFSNWHTTDATEKIDVLTAGGTMFFIMRWNLTAFKGMRVVQSGLLELTSCSVQHSSDYLKDFGMVRVVEIMGGDSTWNEKNVTFNTFCDGKSIANVLNSQMIIDIDVSERRGDRNLATIPYPVLQRLVVGKTLGLAIIPLGSINASFYRAKGQQERHGVVLHLNADQSPRPPNGTSER